MDSIQSALEPYVPGGTSGDVADLVRRYQIYLHIKRNRRTKSGDYRAPYPGSPRHKISINHNLNRYSFLLTFLHEVAHRIVWEKYRDRVKPHGTEWKYEFQLLMIPFLDRDIFPKELRPAILTYIKNPNASSTSDDNLYRELRKYDDARSRETLLEDLDEGVLFSLGDDRVFRKGKLQRKRYLCECLTNRRIYLVNGIAPVFPHEKK